MDGGRSTWNQWPVKIYIRNICEEDIKNGDTPRYKWSIFIDRTEPSSFMQVIDKVTYHLHSTFTQPDFEVKRGQNDNFRLDAAGWGEFTVGIDIEYLGKVQKAKHNLVLTERGNITQITLKS